MGTRKDMKDAGRECSKISPDKQQGHPNYLNGTVLNKDERTLLLHCKKAKSGV